MTVKRSIEIYNLNNLNKSQYSKISEVVKEEKRISELDSFTYGLREGRTNVLCETFSIKKKEINKDIILFHSKTDNDFRLYAKLDMRKNVYKLITYEYSKKRNKVNIRT